MRVLLDAVGDPYKKMKKKNKQTKIAFELLMQCPTMNDKSMLGLLLDWDTANPLEIAYIYTANSQKYTPTFSHTTLKQKWEGVGVAN